jgi:hypothetical protein
MRSLVLGTLAKMWTSEWGLTLLLILLTVLIFIVYPMMDVGISSNLGMVVFTLLLASGVPAAGGMGSFVGRTNALLAAAWIGVEILISYSPTYPLLIAEACAAILALLFLESTLMVQVFKKGDITAHRIRGAVAIYLLLGLSWAWMYRLTLLLSPGAIIHSGAPGLDLVSGTRLLYFSFTTLCTVGYGDIVPLHPFARSLSNLEALTGQLYPVILIGRLVSLGGGPRQK